MKNHGSDSIRSAECFFFYIQYLPPVVIYGYYATYLIARARNEIHVHVLLPVCTIRMNTGQWPLVVAMYFCVGVVVSIGC